MDGDGRSHHAEALYDATKDGRDLVMIARAQ